MLTELIHAVGDSILAAPTPTPDVPAVDPNPQFDPKPFVLWLMRIVAVPVLAVLGVIFIGRSFKGQLSSVLVSTGIALFGLAFIAGAVALPFLGDDLLDLFIK